MYHLPGTRFNDPLYIRIAVSIGVGQHGSVLDHRFEGIVHDIWELRSQCQCNPHVAEWQSAIANE